MQSCPSHLLPQGLWEACILVNSSSADCLLRQRHPAYKALQLLCSSHCARYACCAAAAGCVQALASMIAVAMCNRAQSERVYDCLQHLKHLQRPE